MNKITVAFTICSNNYLAHAKTLGDSFKKYHPDIKFIIGLVDRLNPDFDYSFFKEIEIIPVEDINVKCFEELKAKYNIVELNTAVKPTYFHYLFDKFKADKVIYIDPDILVTSRFDEVIEKLDDYNIILTPHITSPIDDEFAPTDYHTLRGGVFNLGFIGLSNYFSVSTFLDWWHDRVVKYGYANFSKNMFYDQLWMNYVPVMYDNYYILKNAGYNMANWNLHERILSLDDEGKYIVNKKDMLVFFHFSSYKFNNPETICSYLTRFNFNNRPDLIKIFSEYQTKLLENKIVEISKIPVFYYPVKVQIKQPVLKRVYSRIKMATKILIKGNG